MRCLYCYQPLADGENDFHSRCSKKIFGQSIAPELPYVEDEMIKLATQVISNQTTVTGVQPKLSLHLVSENKTNAPKKFTIIGLWGGYILKPPTSNYPSLPEVEDLTMHLASIANINVVPHSLLRLKNGNLGYITKRIDRVKNEKIHMEDMCQLTERLSEDKYYGSYEQIAKAINKYSVNPGLDIINFFEMVLFSFLTGNADMHLKNFSLIYQPAIGPILSPAYDMVATAIVNPSDDEDLALTLNGKKKNINRNDFLTAFNTLNLEERQQANIFTKMQKAKAQWLAFIDNSFLTLEMKTNLKSLIDIRFERIKVKAAN